MSVVTRGFKNAFRSGVRTTAVILILAISMGLALSMLLANQAVKDRLEDVKRNVGTTVLVFPSGSKGFQGGGEPLKTDDLNPVKGLTHIKEVSMNLSLMLTTEGDSQNSMLKIVGGSGIKSGETNLQSSIDPGTIGNRIHKGDSVSSMPDEDFKLPIRMAGLSGTKNEEGKSFNIIDGRMLAEGDTNSAVVGKGLAAKNGLSVGSTFTAYKETFTVVGIYDAGTEFGNDGLYVPLAKAQALSEAGSEITSAIVTVDSVDNVTIATENIKTTLGDKADVTASEENALTAVESLRSIQKVSIIGFVIALGAAAVIIFLTMLMIVRERRREIGVLKAIGGSNRSIVTQFVVEAVVLVAISAVIGFGVAAVSSNSIAGALVKSNTSENTDDGGPRAGMPGSGGLKTVRINGPGGPNLNDAKDLVGNITTSVSAKSLSYGLLAAIGIAIVGSAIPAWFITKIRPAEVLRGE